MLKINKSFTIKESDIVQKMQEAVVPSKEPTVVGENLVECPSCSQSTLKVDGGCVDCVNPDCGYGKCDV